MIEIHILGGGGSDPLAKLENTAGNREKTGGKSQTFLLPYTSS